MVSFVNPVHNWKFALNLLTYMRVFLLWFVRVGDPTAQLTNMYATSPESGASGAVYRLLFISIAFIYCEYKAKKN